MVPQNYRPQTQPGSTAKVMSAMAGFMGLGKDVTKLRYFNYTDEIVHEWNHDPNVNIRDAIVYSSNNYFINLIHDQDLYDELDSIYQTVGIRIDEDGDYHKDRLPRSATPYFFEIDELGKNKLFTELLDDNRSHAMDIFKKYMKAREVKKRTVWNKKPTGIAWGQGVMSATPLNMARVASIVANDGELVPTRYVLQEGDEKMDTKKPVRILSSETNKLLKSYMGDEAKKNIHSKTGIRYSFKNAKDIGGKTGTPERGGSRAEARHW